MICRGVNSTTYSRSSTFHSRLASSILSVDMEPTWISLVHQRFSGGLTRFLKVCDQELWISGVFLPKYAVFDGGWGLMGSGTRRNQAVITTPIHKLTRSYRFYFWHLFLWNIHNISELHQNVGMRNRNIAETIRFMHTLAVKKRMTERTKEHEQK